MRQGAGRCPDCPARAERGEILHHAYTCPVAVSERAQRADDLRWFRDNPDAEYRERDLSSDERVHLRILGARPDGVRVQVRRAGPSGRALQLWRGDRLIAAPLDRPTGGWSA